MRKLISADLFRLMRSRMLWLCVAAVFAIDSYNYYDCWNSLQKFGFEQELAQQAFSSSPEFGLALAVICGLFLGEEFSYGTIRNKLVIGHERVSIYLSALAVSICSGLLAVASHFAATALVGIPLLGIFRRSLVTIAWYTFCLICVVCVFAAILTLLVMLCASRTMGVVLGILLILGMMYVSASIENRLSEPENNMSYTLIDSETYQPLEVEETPNPRYLKGTKREVYQWMHDVMPMGQCIQISNLDGLHPLRWPIASAVEFLLVTGAGIWLFLRKDLN